MKNSEKVYLGDGVYAAYDGHMVELTTSNGDIDTNTIFLEPQVIESLLRYLEKLKDPT